MDQKFKRRILLKSLRAFGIDINSEKVRQLDNEELILVLTDLEDDARRRYQNPFQEVCLCSTLGQDFKDGFHVWISRN